MSPKGLNFQPVVSISDSTIGDGFPTYIIAEAGVSHLGDPSLVQPLVEMSARANVSAFKSQHFYIRELVSKTSPDWYDRLAPKQLSDEAILLMRDLSLGSDLPFLCTAHNESALDFLVKQAKVPAIKIGSGELHNFIYLEQAASYGLPIILSTGMHTLSQIEETVDFLYDHNVKELVILHCITNYPTPVNHVHLKVLSQIRNFFSGPIGYSDHTSGIDACLAAVALGASVIEKHITLFKNIPNAQDWKVSCDAEELVELVNKVRLYESLIGDNSPKTISSDELASISWATKSLFASIDIPANTSLEVHMCSSLRPGNGIPVSQLQNLIGMTTKTSISAGTQLKYEYFN